MLGTVTESLESIGKAFEAVPGWARADRVLSDVADGLAFGLALLWALRWIWLLLAFALVATGFINSP